MSTRSIALVIALLLASSTSFAANEFDLPEAMTAAGEQVPAALETYSFFYIQAQAGLERDAKELSERLRVAAAENDYIGLAGPNASWNRSVLQSAIEANTGRNLAGLTIVYLGPSADSGSVKALVEQSGASLKYVIYPSGS